MCGIKFKVHGVAKDTPRATYIYVARDDSTREISWETGVAREQHATKAMRALDLQRAGTNY